MTSQISINVSFGNSSVEDSDKERAEAAALSALGDVDPAAAYAEYVRQWEELDTRDGMTGLAALWVEAARAADLALTAGWRNPDGASCEISA